MATAKTYQLDGGCSCGDVRYAVKGAVLGEGASFCHCRQCQRSCGAPVLVFAAFKKADVTLTKGTPKVYQSSAKGLRKFCGTCGTQLFWESPDPKEDDVDITVNSFDDPEAIRPLFHQWTSSKVSWLAVDPALKCYPEGRSAGVASA